MPALLPLVRPGTAIRRGLHALALGGVLGVTACTSDGGDTPTGLGSPAASVAAAAAGSWSVDVTDLRAPNGARCAITGIRLTIAPPPAGGTTVTGTLEAGDPAPLVACPPIATPDAGPLPPAPTPGALVGRVEGDVFVLGAPGGWTYRVPAGDVSVSAPSLRGTVQVVPSGAATTFSGTATLTRR